MLHTVPLAYFSCLFVQCAACIPALQEPAGPLFPPPMLCSTWIASWRSLIQLRGPPASHEREIVNHPSLTWMIFFFNETDTNIWWKNIIIKQYVIVKRYLPDVLFGAIWTQNDTNFWHWSLLLFFSEVYLVLIWIVVYFCGACKYHRTHAGTRSFMKTAII